MCGEVEEAILTFITTLDSCAAKPNQVKIAGGVLSRLVISIANSNTPQVQGGERGRCGEVPAHKLFDLISVSLTIPS